MLVPAYNRVDNLAVTLATITPLLPAYASVMVVDDASVGDAIPRLCAGYPKVDYVRTPHNMGVIGARNFGVDRVDTEFLIHIDDDSYFADPDLVAKTVQLFQENPDVAAIAYNIAIGSDAPRVPITTQPYLSRTYTGCGNAWRMQAVAKLGSFYEGFWRQGEEVEHAMRIYDAGYTIMSEPSLVIRHDESPVNRDPRRHLSLEAANYLKRIALRVPAWHLPEMLARWFGFLALHWPELSIGQIWQDLLSPDRSLARALRDRVPIRSDTFRRLEELKKSEARLLSVMETERA